MPFHINRVEWMPSPPLAPENGPIDLLHLERMTLGDQSLEREVLAMFAAQAGTVLRALAALPPDAPALAHTLKGSARAIGAFDVADAAEHLESAMADERRVAKALVELNAAVAEATAAIDTILLRS